MLRVGLTGGLGSGKSTAAQMFAGHGAVVFQSDAIGRELMEPGQDVYRAIIERFGADVVLADGTLDRAALARLAFEQGDVEALNAIVHPAVLARQEELMGALPADAVAVVESALIFETKYGGAKGWRSRFDCMVLVTAPEKLKIARFVKRSSEGSGRVSKAVRDGFEAAAWRRLALQIPDAVKMPQCDFILINDGRMKSLETQVADVWSTLTRV